MKKIYGLSLALLLSLGCAGFESNVCAAAERLGENRKDKQVCYICQVINSASAQECTMCEQPLAVGTSRPVDVLLVGKVGAHQDGLYGVPLQRDYPKKDLESLAQPDDKYLQSLAEKSRNGTQEEQRRPQQLPLLQERVFSFEDWKQRIFDREPYMRNLPAAIVQDIYAEYRNYCKAPDKAGSVSPEFNELDVQLPVEKDEAGMVHAPGGPGWVQ